MQKANNNLLVRAIRLLQQSVNDKNSLISASLSLVPFLLALASLRLAMPNITRKPNVAQNANLDIRKKLKKESVL